MTTTELNNIDAEMALLGCVLINPLLAQTVRIQAGDFYLGRHRTIWNAIKRLQERGLDVDFLTVSDELDRDGSLEKIGGPAYIARLSGIPPNTLHAESYAYTVRDLAMRRRLIDAASQLAQAAGDLEEDPLDSAALVIDRVNRVGASPDSAVPVADWAHEAIEAIVARKEHPDAAFSLSTGFVDLDKMVGKLYPNEGTYFLLAGQPGIGKTILMQNMAEHMARQAPGVIYSSEMKRMRLMFRSFSAKTGISVKAMKQGKVEDHHIETLFGTAAYYEDLPLFVSDAGSWTTASLRADLLRLKNEHNVQWFAFDYLDLLEDTIPGLKSYDRTREVSRRLLGICRQLELVAIVIHTLNKEGFNSSAGLASFSGSAGVVYDADIGAYLAVDAGNSLFTQAVYQYLDLKFVKNRDGEGELGDITLAKYKDRPLFITPAGRL